ncbi:unnamed protein product [Cylicocyclus nassatus]|uniref:C2H2-type domain-containing protein n=1 Tax=Cylicocyclus nassatus TaxID=53992 RepID=A0AA36M9N8_CYLNA|nr:unnamed protein product [Cylicocyclus nassatus]
MDQKMDSKCSHCGKAFACKRYLVKHVARVHSRDKEEKKPLECGICGKDFPRLSHLQRHQLIHIKEREWGCPFCECSFVQKPHLIRHIGRRHPTEESTGLEDKINANKWRTESIPVQLSTSDSVAKTPLTPQLCADLIPALLCITCGATFSTRTDLDRHAANTHRPLKCRHCRKIFNGYAKLKAHEMQQRDQAHVCSCGASFVRAAELRNHKDSCRKRGSFLCVVCEEVFTQRIQLDRHWNKKHFTNSRCPYCECTAAAPLRLSEHALKEHSKKICGYCGVKNPLADHVAATHWRRLSKSVALKNKQRRGRHGDSVAVEEQSIDVDEGKELSSGDESISDDAHESQILSPVKDYDSSTTSTSSSDSESTLVDRKDIDCSTSCDARNSEDCFLNVVVSVPDDVVDEFHFGHRLPPEILRLFPEFSSAKLSLVEPFIGQSRFLSLHIPVSKPPEGDTEVARLLSVPIYV